MPHTSSTTVYLRDGRHIEVPADAVQDWRLEVEEGQTLLGLADWYTAQGDAHQEEIVGERPAVYDEVCAVIDAVKTDARSLDTDAYAGMILDAVRESA